MKLSIPMTNHLGLALALLLVLIVLYPTAAQAQAPINLTAKSANIADSGTTVKLNILRWSSDEERKPIVAALDPVAQAAAQAAAATGGRGGGARGGRGGARGDQDAAAGLDPNDPALADLVAGARGGRGGRGGRGDGEPSKPPDPIATMTRALGRAPTVGYLWTNETVGYSIKYAYHMPLPNGGERIILATDRRLGAGTIGWKLAATGTPTDYEFTLIEIRMDSKGAGEGKASLTSKVVFDAEAKTPALDNYAAAPAILQGVKR
jgi:hypothetical protein